MKNWHLLFLALFCSPAFADGEGTFDCKGSEDGPSPTYSSECKQVVTDKIAELCATKAKNVKLGKVNYIGNSTNAAGGCNHTYSVTGSGQSAGACAGGDTATVTVEATRGGCLLQ